MKKEALISQAKQAIGFTNDYVIEQAEKNSINFIGIGKNDGSLSDIRMMRTAFEPSSLCGNQHGRNMTISLDTR